MIIRVDTTDEDFTDGTASIESNVIIALGPLVGETGVKEFRVLWFPGGNVWVRNTLHNHEILKEWW